MRSRCKTVSPQFRNAIFMALSLFLAGGAFSGARAADQNDDGNHKSIIGVPSMPEDFVQAPELNSRSLAAPSANQFRYLKLDYAVRKDIEPDSKEDAADNTTPSKKPVTKSPEQNTTTTAQSPSASSRGEGLRLDSHSAPLDLTPLNLTADQKQKICDLHKDNVKKARDLRKLLKTKKDDLATAMFDPDQTEAAIRDKRDTVRAAREQMEDLAFDEILKVRQLLNPEQKKHLAEVKPVQRDRRDWDGAPGQSTAIDSTKPTTTGKGDLSKADATKSAAPGKIAEASKADGVKSGSSKDASAKLDSKPAKADSNKQ